MTRADRVSPDCRVGKHTACSGDAWDDELDVPCECVCACHLGGAAREKDPAKP